jgi:hypothetical protein
VSTASGTRHSAVQRLSPRTANTLAAPIRPQSEVAAEDDRGDARIGRDQRCERFARCLPKPVSPRRLATPQRPEIGLRPPKSRPGPSAGKRSPSSPIIFFPPTASTPTTYHAISLSPPPASACPPDTMWLREGFPKAISSRGKGFRTHLSGSPLVNSFGFNKALRISRTYMSGMGSFMEETTQVPPIGSTWAHGSAASRPSPSSPINVPPLRRCPQTDEGDPLRETRSLLGRLLSAPRRHQPRPADRTIHRYEEFGDACFRLSSLAVSPPKITARSPSGQARVL